MPLSALPLVLALLVAAPHRSVAAAPASQPARAHGRFSASERAAMARITPASLSGPLRFLSDDLLEGRKPGSTGADLAVKYLAAELEGAGYAPGVLATADAPQPSFFQPGPLITLQGRPPRQVPVQGSGRELQLSTLHG